MDEKTVEKNKKRVMKVINKHFDETPETISGMIAAIRDMVDKTNGHAVLAYYPKDSDTGFALLHGSRDRLSQGLAQVFNEARNKEGGMALFASTLLVMTKTLNIPGAKDIVMNMASLIAIQDTVLPALLKAYTETEKEESNEPIIQ
ncbi:MAG: hypothetical protein JW885_02590 [Deltaproteobacteria bacterium]|nr:hypothetical protein [Candidatus Zymogenaceae bacterium]